MFHPHPSHLLTEHFHTKPYQGADPFDARFLFVGLDANYAADIENSPIFPMILQYHEDGPGFWRTNGVHHPFLLAQYKGAGHFYHSNFAKIGFQPSNADLVSFIELLNSPTVGRSDLTINDLDPTHLKLLRRVIFEGNAKFIFLSASVKRLLLASGLFPELRAIPRNYGALRILYQDDERSVFLHLHFSNYGTFEKQLQAEAREILNLLAKSLGRD